MKLRDPNIFFDAQGDKTLSIGNNVEFGFANRNSKIVIESPVIIAQNSRIDCDYIGAYTFINENVTIRHTAKIGRYCSIAPNVYIGLVNHPVKAMSTSDFFYGKEKWKFCRSNYDYQEKFEISNSKITVGNDVWIGMGAMIMRGVHIADGSIIAAGAVLTRDTEPFEIVGGGIC